MGRLTTLSPQSSNRRCNAQSAALARKRGQNKRKRGKDASRAACLLCSVLEKGEVCSLEKYWKADMCPPASELPILYFTIVMFSIAIRRGLLYFTIVNFEVPAGSVGGGTQGGRFECPTFATDHSFIKGQWNKTA